MGTKLRELVALLVFHQQLNKRNLRVRQEIQLNNQTQQKQKTFKTPQKQIISSEQTPTRHLIDINQPKTPKKQQ